MTNTNSPLLNPRELHALYFHQEYDKLSEKLIAVLSHFENKTYLEIDPGIQYLFNSITKNFLYFFTQVDYKVSERYGLRFMQLNATISNLVAVSDFKTTDAYLELLKYQPDNLLKFLALYSARNTVKVDRSEFFAANSQLASLWYSHYFDIFSYGLVNKESYQNLREHLQYTDRRLTDFYNFSALYFGATYIDGDRDRDLKLKINQSIKKGGFCTTTNIQNTPNPKKIAIITQLWYARHSVYLADFVDSLKDDYELTLVCPQGTNEIFDMSDFKEIKYIDCEAVPLNIDSININDFVMVYYPDVGMTPSSIILANLRLAPIQVCGVGHSVSTFGSEIDYYISGADVEISSGAEANYSERLVVLPGLGITNKYPNYKLRNKNKKSVSKNKKSREPVIINCSWLSHKINYPMVEILKEIVTSSKRNILFMIFGGGGEALVRNNGFLPFARDLEAILGKDCFELIPGKPYEEYMASMEAGDMCIESYHFGGCNIVADTLYLRKPIVTFEGDRWYNRIGSQMRRSIGLSELIATNRSEYIELTLKLIHDDQYRFSIQEKLQHTDLNSTIFNSENKKYFKKAVDFLIENHSQLKSENSRKPILIK